MVGDSCDQFLGALDCEHFKCCQRVPGDFGDRDLTEYYIHALLFRPIFGDVSLNGELEARAVCWGEPILKAHLDHVDTRLLSKDCQLLVTVLNKAW